MTRTKTSLVNGAILSGARDAFLRASIWRGRGRSRRICFSAPQPFRRQQVRGTGRDTPQPYKEDSRPEQGC